MGYQNINEANQAVIDRIISARPYLIDVVPAKSVIKELNEKVLLHSGPPIEWKQMTEPMKGSCYGAAIYEGWVTNEEEAHELLSTGKVEFMPCHHVNAVGPMGGITSGNMPVFVVENRDGGNRAYCVINEGMGQVLKFGAYNEEVVTRLHWIQNMLGPALSKAVLLMDEGMDLTAIVAKAITMGDEFHQRNTAASALFIKEIMPFLLKTDVSREDLEIITEFISNMDQFFLSLIMAYGKSVMDSARTIEEGTVVTAMCRNGYEFGIRISGMGNKWFTAPVNIPEGIFFNDYSQEDANPDIGDSCITETFGVGGMAMIAAPAVTKFVGAGGLEDAQRISNEMKEICIDYNPNLPIPNWDFKGACLGIDTRKIVKTGITPLITTGIAHKKAGIGQIGAGTVRAPLECFVKALEAFKEKYPNR